MKHNKVLGNFLISVAAVSLLFGYHALTKDKLSNNIKAEDDYSEIKLSTHGLNPHQDDEYSGVFTIGYSEFFYLSHAEAITGQTLSLKAKDNKTPGVLVNKSVINGLKSVKVTFSGGALYAIATSSFYERYEYSGDDLLTSDVAKYFEGTDLGYLLFISPETSGVTIIDISIKYTCKREVDSKFFYAPEVNRYTGARSYGANRLMLHDYIEFTTDPKHNNNNYSTGKTHDPEEPYVDSWYRWNGVSLRNHHLVGQVPVYDEVPFGNFVSNSFEVITSVIVEPRVFYDDEAWFSASPWVALDSADHSELIDYMQSHIGNDNYDPLGGIHARTDTYRGRFYTNWAKNGGGYDWGFVNPDVATVVGSTMTLRAAYEATNLPFFHVRFEVIGNNYAVYINGFKVQEEVDFFYEDYVDQQYSINNIALHGVNYGLHDGTAGDASSVYNPYRLTYLNPIVRKIV